MLTNNVPDCFPGGGGGKVKRWFPSSPPLAPFFVRRIYHCPLPGITQVINSRSRNAKHKVANVTSFQISKFLHKDFLGLEIGKMDRA